MVTFTDSQADEIMKRLARVQENAIAIDEERVYWKGVAEQRYKENTELRHQLADNYFQSQQSLKQEVGRLTNRLKSTEEELAMTQKALVNSLEIIDEKNRQVERLAATVNEYVDENERLRQVAHQNAVAADGFAREVAMLREHNRIQSNTNSCYNWLLHNLDKMRQDYAAHRGRYGGTGIAEELVKLMNGELYVASNEDGK
jgi:chromosome segregation ATPase